MTRPKPLSLESWCCCFGTNPDSKKRRFENILRLSFAASFSGPFTWKHKCMQTLKHIQHLNTTTHMDAHTVLQNARFRFALFGEFKRWKQGSSKGWPLTVFVGLDPGVNPKPQAMLRVKPGARGHWEGQQSNSELRLKRLKRGNRDAQLFYLPHDKFCFLFENLLWITISSLIS